MIARIRGKRHGVRGKRPVTEHESGDKSQKSRKTSTWIFGSWHLTRGSFLIVAILIFPIFAHGCHREDVDDEPGFIPLTHLSEPEATR